MMDDNRFAVLATLNSDSDSEDEQCLNSQSEVNNQSKDTQNVKQTDNINETDEVTQINKDDDGDWSVVKSKVKTDKKKKRWKKRKDNWDESNRNNEFQSNTSVVIEEESNTNVVIQEESNIAIAN
ncbi:hypothetical protein CPAV1605_290 [seawater metagenome]|uniref:Uncharacterized protein n=1 Tax=seawater metagenome TaxID=1561972 RepID=A0A5E8CL27_9ZZZZ